MLTPSPILRRYKSRSCAEWCGPEVGWPAPWATGTNDLVIAAQPLCQFWDPSMIPNLIGSRATGPIISFLWDTHTLVLVSGMKPLTVIWPAPLPRKRVVWATSGSRWILVILRACFLLKSFTQIGLAAKQTAKRPCIQYVCVSTGTFLPSEWLLMKNIVALLLQQFLVIELSVLGLIWNWGFYSFSLLSSVPGLLLIHKRLDSNMKSLWTSPTKPQHGGIALDLRLGFHASLPNPTGREAETMDGLQDDIPLPASDWRYQFAGSKIFTLKQSGTSDGVVLVRSIVRWRMIEVWRYGIL